MKIPIFCWHLGFRYTNGKFLIYKMNCAVQPSLSGPASNEPSWAVDIREVLAMLFVGTSALMLIYSKEVDNAMVLLVGLLSYAIGRTVPGKGK